jgi:hypothetical protein
MPTKTSLFFELFSCPTIIISFESQQRGRFIASYWLRILICVVQFEPESAEYWGSTSKKMVCLFALGASILAADPMAIDEQGHLKNL